MKTVKELRRSVLQQMRSCWGENAAIFLITAGGAAAVALAWYIATDMLKIFGVTDPAASRIDISNGTVIAVTAAALVILFCVADPFVYGVKWYRLQHVRGRSVQARSMFSCYGSWKRAGQIFRLSAYLFAGRLYFTVPLAALLGAGIFFADKIGANGNSVVYSAAETLVFLLAGSLICAAALFNCKYAAVTYLFVLDPDSPPKELIRKSAEISKGKTDYLIEAVLSSAKCLPLCVLIFPAVFVIPYMQMVYTAAVNEIILSGETSPEQDGRHEEYAHS
ncbi:MAG: DUF975 family protein [Prevotella sp.]|nr:DUF975 family protein [Prevotella sp.]